MEREGRQNPRLNLASATALPSANPSKNWWNVSAANKVLNSSPRIAPSAASPCVSERVSRAGGLGRTDANDDRVHCDAKLQHEDGYLLLDGAKLCGVQPLGHSCSKPIAGVNRGAVDGERGEGPHLARGRV